MRRQSAALRWGAWEALPTCAGVLAGLRTHGEDRRAILVNFTDEPRELALAGSWTVEVASHGAAGERYEGALLPDQALVLR